jgi:hypothetical protein
VVGTLAIIDAIAEDDALSDAEKMVRIRTLLTTKETRRILQKDQLTALKEALVSELGEDDYYRILESRSVWCQNRVSPILKVLTFQGDPGTLKSLDAIEHFKEQDGVIDKTAPTAFLNSAEQTMVMRDGKFRVSLYKALLFAHVQSACRAL